MASLGTVIEGGKQAGLCTHQRISMSFTYIPYCRLGENSQMMTCLFDYLAKAPLLCNIQIRRKKLSWKRAVPQTRMLIGWKPQSLVNGRHFVYSSICTGLAQLSSLGAFMLQCIYFIEKDWHFQCQITEKTGKCLQPMGHDCFWEAWTNLLHG